MAAPDVKVGDRVVISGKLTGAVRFAGETKFAEGEWFGVELDELKGKNNGCVQDVQYFTCDAMKGMFVRRAMLEPEPAGGVKRGSKQVKRPSELGKTKRKSSLTGASAAATSPGSADLSSPSSPSRPEPLSMPSSPSAPAPADNSSPMSSSSRTWQRRRSDALTTNTAINVDSQEEMVDAVRNCALEVSRLEEMVKSLSFTLDDAAVRETVCNAPAALFTGEAMPDMMSDMEALLEGVTARLEQKLQDKLADTLEEQLREALAPRIEDLVIQENEISAP